MRSDSLRYRGVGWGALVLAGFALCLSCGAAAAQGAGDPRYQTRPSDCRHQPPAGTQLSIRRVDSGILAHGYTVERILTLLADARGLQGGDIVVCAEYGRVEILDSDDDQVRLQIRMEGFGEGAVRPPDAAARAIDETNVDAFITESNGRLMVTVWHATLGFTRAPGGQPAFISIRLQVPSRGSYRVTAEAFHGTVAIRRLTLAGATLRGNVGDKFKGIPGFIGETHLDNVVLAGDVDIDNLAGLPGIRPPVPPQMSGLAAPILVKARVASPCRLGAVTGGNIAIVIQPDPDLGIRATGLSNQGEVNLAIDGAVAQDASRDSTFLIRRSVATEGLETRRLSIEIRAASGPGTVSIASIPAAPLWRQQDGARRP